MTDKTAIANAINYTFSTPNESDSNGECANVVDGLFRIARAIDRLAKAVEGLSVQQTTQDGTQEAVTP